MEVRNDVSPIWAFDLQSEIGCKKPNLRVSRVLPQVSHVVPCGAFWHLKHGEKDGMLVKIARPTAAVGILSTHLLNITCTRHPPICRNSHLEFDA